MAYTLVAGDNFHPQNSEFERDIDIYATPDTVLAAAKAFLQKSIRECHKPGMTAQQLFEAFGLGGEITFIFADAGSPEVVFDPWAYAEEQAAIIAAEPTDPPLKLLFICTSNRLRSPTAQDVFADWDGVQTASAGTDSAATRVVDTAMVEEADAVFVMEQHHKAALRKRFRAVLGDKPVIVLGIRDEFERDAPELVELLLDRAGPHIEMLRQEAVSGGASACSKAADGR